MCGTDAEGADPRCSGSPTGSVKINHNRKSYVAQCLALRCRCASSRRLPLAREAQYWKYDSIHHPRYTHPRKGRDAAVGITPIVLGHSCVVKRRSCLDRSESAGLYNAVRIHQNFHLGQRAHTQAHTHTYTRRDQGPGLTLKRCPYRWTTGHETRRQRPERIGSHFWLRRNTLWGQSYSPAELRSRERK